MAKKKTVDEEVDGNKIAVELREMALSITRDEPNNDWLIVRIMYDLTSGEVSKPEIVIRERSRGEIQSKFRILVSQELL